MLQCAVSSVAVDLPVPSCPGARGPIQPPLVSAPRELTACLSCDTETHAQWPVASLAWTINSSDCGSPTLGLAPPHPWQLWGPGAGFAFPLHPTPGWFSCCVWRTALGPQPRPPRNAGLHPAGCTQLAPGPSLFLCGPPGAGIQLPPNSAPSASHTSSLPSGAGARESGYHSTFIKSQCC